MLSKLNSYSQLGIPDEYTNQLLMKSEKEIVSSGSKLFSHPQFIKIKKNFRDLISEKKYVLFENFDLESDLLKDKKSKLLIIASLLGTPTSHTNNDENFVWDIIDDPTDNINFSKTNSAIPLHTDSQFKDNPEKYFLLNVCNASNYGDGITTLLKYDNIIKQLLQKANGPKYYKILSSQEYPSVVPNIFSKEEKLSFDKIITKDQIKYRKDTILKGLKMIEKLPYEKLEAFHFLSSIIENSKDIQYVNLKTNDLIFIDNHFCLHGRTEFKDTNRHLIRIRFC